MKINKNETVVFGDYHGPIEWQVLDKKDGKALLISKYGLDNKAIVQDFAYVTWESSPLRKWLNDEFFKEAFSTTERKEILKSDVPADDNPDYRVALGADTKDKVFLLSYKEAKQYFKDDKARKCSGTDYAKTQGLHVEYDGYSWWWLRTPGYTGYFTSFVHANGEPDAYGYTAMIDRSLVRPAIWVNLD